MKLIRFAAIAAVLFSFASLTRAEIAPASSAGAAKPLKTGDSIPDVTLVDMNGKSVDLRKAVAERPAAIIFYRGGWCPYCMKHLADVGKIKDDIKKAGYQILAITPDKPEIIKQTADKKELEYTLLSDSDNAAARAFGVAFTLDADTLEKYTKYGIDLTKQSGGKNKDVLPVPAFYLVSKDGKIIFDHSDPDYTKRIAKEDILAAIAK